MDYTWIIVLDTGLRDKWIQHRAEQRRSRQSNSNDSNENEPADKSAGGKRSRKHIQCDGRPKGGVEVPCYAKRSPTAGVISAGS